MTVTTDTAEPCINCMGSAPTGDRLSEGHVAVRFGDRFFHVYFDGVDVSNQCIEAFAGPEGWVAMIPSPKVVCPNNRSHAYTVLRYGDIQIAKSGVLWG